MRIAALAIALTAAAALSACDNEQIENVQAKAENESRRLEARHAELEAEASNGTNSAIAPLDNEAEALLSQMNGADAAANASVEGAENAVR
ncbi:MAG TPA: hypothetical protein VGB62_03420 [Allosphingosinicella sp.]|jgi:molecular chaperone GrpE (heat shock protein)